MFIRSKILERKIFSKGSCLIFLIPIINIKLLLQIFAKTNGILEILLYFQRKKIDKWTVFIQNHRIVLNLCTHWLFSHTRNNRKRRRGSTVIRKKVARRCARDETTAEDWVSSELTDAKSMLFVLGQCLALESPDDFPRRPILSYPD